MLELAKSTSNRRHTFYLTKIIQLWFQNENLFPKDDNLGELMSTVCVARVRGWAGVGACSAEGVGDGPDPAGGRLGHATIVLFYWLTRGCRFLMARF